MPAGVRISDETKKKIDALKIALGFPTISDVLEMLIENYEHVRGINVTQIVETMQNLVPIEDRNRLKKSSLNTIDDE